MISVQASHCQDDVLSIALENARLSGAGSIRKAHDVVTWLGKMDLLRKSGVDASAVIVRWNKMASQRTMLTGQKRVGLLNLMESLSMQNVQQLIELVSMYGSDGAIFSDECFSNKRLLPGQNEMSNNEI